MQNVLFILLLIVSGIINAFVALYALKNNRIKANVLLCLIFLLGAFWAFTYTQELLAQGLYVKLIWDNLQFISTSFLPVCWMVMILAISSKKPKSRILITILCIVPIITNILAWSNQYHQLIRTSEHLIQIGMYSYIVKNHGFWFWVQAVYSNGLNFLTLILTFYSFIKGGSINRRQAAPLLIGFMMIFASSVVYLLSQESLTYDYTPIVFGFSALIIGGSILKDKSFNLAPLARDELFDRMHTGVIVLDELDRVVDMNKAALHIFGLASIDSIVRLPIRCIISDWREKLYSEMQEDRFKWEMNIDIDGEELCYELDVSDLKDRSQNITGKLVVLYDITERKRSEEILAYNANHDSLTGLTNRQYLKVLTKRLMEKANYSKKLMAVLYVDLDSFKRMNDRFGHEAGDILLREAAQKLSKLTREGDITARIGGDEFIVLLTELDSEHQALGIAEKIVMSFREPIRVGGENLTITLSVGISYYPVDAEEIDDLIKKADIAMYWVKNNGRNNFKEYRNIPTESKEVDYEDTIL